MRNSPQKTKDKLQCPERERQTAWRHTEKTGNAILAENVEWRRETFFGPSAPE